MLELRNCTVVFNENTIDETKALDNISLVCDEGDFITIIGSNGAGKSTLLNVINGTVALKSGQVFNDGEDITDYPDFKRANKIGCLSQNPLKGTAPHMTIEENCLLAYGRGVKRRFKFKISNEEKQLFKDACASLELGLENRMEAEVGVLSGGQRQALTLLMATLVPPKCLLLDEHTAALDPKIAKHMMELTDKIVKKHNITTLMITHNIDQALQYGNKTLIMKGGTILDVLEGERRKNTTKEDIMKVYERLHDTLADSFILAD